MRSLLLTLLVFLGTLSSPANAEPRLLRAGTIVSYFEKQQKSHPLSEQEKKTLLLARVGFELGASLREPKEKSDDDILPLLTPRELVPAIREVTPTEWSSAPSAKLLPLLKEKRAELEGLLATQSAFTWAWIRYELGEKKEGLDILRDLHKKEVEQVLKLKTAVYGPSYSPLRLAEKLHGTLHPLVESAEGKELEATMQKLKEHVEKLPKKMVVF